MKVTINTKDKTIKLHEGLKIIKVIDWLKDNIKDWEEYTILPIEIQYKYTDKYGWPKITYSNPYDFYSISKTNL